VGLVVTAGLEKRSEGNALEGALLSQKLVAPQPPLDIVLDVT
jgi:hypothetical protein